MTVVALQLLEVSNEGPVRASACSAFARVLRFSPSLCCTVALQAVPVLRYILEVKDARMQVSRPHCLTCDRDKFVIYPGICSS
jgi:hypothetical protein